MNTPVKVVGWRRYILGTCLRFIPLLGASMAIWVGVSTLLDELGYGDTAWFGWLILLIPVLFVLFTVGFVVRDVIVRCYSTVVATANDGNKGAVFANSFLFLNAGAKRPVVWRTAEYLSFALMFISAIILVLSSEAPYDTILSLPKVDIPVFLTASAGCVITCWALLYAVTGLLFPSLVTSPR